MKIKCFCLNIIGFILIAASFNSYADNDKANLVKKIINQNRLEEQFVGQYENCKLLIKKTFSLEKVLATDPKRYEKAISSLERRSEFNLLFEQFYQDYCSYIEPKNIIGAWSAQLSDKLTETELNQAIAFNETLSGRKILSVFFDVNSYLTTYLYDKSVVSSEMAAKNFEARALAFLKKCNCEKAKE